MTNAENPLLWNASVPRSIASRPLSICSQAEEEAFALLSEAFESEIVEQQRLIDGHQKWTIEAWKSNRIVSLNELLIVRLEIDAAEACDWMIAAGFPHYVQMYKDHQFPIDLHHVREHREHSDEVLLNDLHHRLCILNKLSTMQQPPVGNKCTHSTNTSSPTLSSNICTTHEVKKLRQSPSDKMKHSLLTVYSQSEYSHALEDSAMKEDSFPFKSQKRSSSSSSSESESNDKESPRCLNVNPQSVSAPYSSTAPPCILLDESASYELVSRDGLSQSNIKSTHQHHLTTGEQLQQFKVKQRTPRLFRSASARLNKTLNDLRQHHFNFRSLRRSQKRTSASTTKSTSLPTTTTATTTLDTQPPSKSVSTQISKPETSARMNTLQPHCSTMLVQPQHANGYEMDSEARLMSTSSTLPLHQSHHKVGTIQKNHLSTKSAAAEEMQRSQQKSLSTMVARNKKVFIKGGGAQSLDQGSGNSSSLFDSAASRNRTTLDVNLSHKMDSSAEGGEGSRINYRTGSFMGHCRRQTSAKTAANAAAVRAIALAQLELENNHSKCDKTEGEVKSSSELDSVLETLYMGINDLYQFSDILNRTEQEPPCLPKLLLTTSATSSGESVTTSTYGDMELDLEHLEANLAQLDSLLTEEQSNSSLLLSGCHSDYNQSCSGDEIWQKGQDCGLDTSSKHESLSVESGGLKRGGKLRWSSFARSHRPSVQSHNVQLSYMSVAQLCILKKVSLLMLTGTLEKYCPPNKSLWNWFGTKLLKRPHSHYTEPSGRAVFGISLSTMEARTGQPLPAAIQAAMRHIRTTGASAHGIFRKAGGRTRITALRERFDANPDITDFSDVQPYDLADCIKQYFRELPECLLTAKLCPHLINIFTHVPGELRLESLQSVIMLLPDEHRDALQTLLYFLNDMSKESDTTEMNASNLAVCFAPSLFYFANEIKSNGLSPRRLRKITGVPDLRDLADQKAATLCLTYMIQNCHNLFKVSDEALNKCKFSAEEYGEAPELDLVAPIDATKRRHCFAFVDNHAHLVHKECSSSNRFSGNTSSSGSANHSSSNSPGSLVASNSASNKGWVHFACRNNVETQCKKMADPSVLKLWRAFTEIEADATTVLNMIVRERSAWDPELLTMETSELIDDNADVVRLTYDTTAPQPALEVSLLRAWRCEPGGGVAIYATSVATPCTAGYRQVQVMNEDWLVENTSPGRVRVTLLSRVDIRGHSLEWYNRTWGHVIARSLFHLRKNLNSNVADSTSSSDVSKAHTTSKIVPPSKSKFEIS